MDHGELVELIVEGLTRRGVVPEGAMCRCASFEVDEHGNMTASASVDFDFPDASR